MLSSFGYILGGCSFAALTLLYLTAWRRRHNASRIAIATSVTAIVSFISAYADTDAGAPAWTFLFADSVADLTWLIYLGGLLGSSSAAGKIWTLRFGTTTLGVLAALLWVAVGVYIEPNGSNGLLDGASAAGAIAVSLAAIILIEQISRNARGMLIKGLKFLFLGLGILFAYDLVMHSVFLLANNVSEQIWAARGYVYATGAAFVALAASRTPNTSFGLFVSRKIVFYSTALVAAAVYLAIVGLVGFYIRRFGGSIGIAAQSLFFIGAGGLLLTVIASERARALGKVFIAKHFLKDRYDYREEWLRLIQTLTTLEDDLPLRKRAIKALAQILNAPSGLLWMRTSPTEPLRCKSAWNLVGPGQEQVFPDKMAEFLGTTGWVIDLNEWRKDPSRYPELPEDVEVKPELGDGYVVPIIHQGDLLAAISLSAPKIRTTLNFEDRDLLKTAGKQIASYLAQENATEQLAESRQFEAFNKLTAFIMHDLKNAIAQQSMVVENARKHKRNPEFVDDAIATIQSSVNRMRKVVELLQQQPYKPVTKKCDIATLVRNAAAECCDRQPLPELVVLPESVWISCNADRIQAAFVHAITNAQDAAGPDGKVTIRLEVNSDRCDLFVADNGQGMDPEFIRDRLFRPFDSTKGPSGMGIGAYQIKDAIRAAGGDLAISSTKGAGTELRISLPISR